MAESLARTGAAYAEVYEPSRQGDIRKLWEKADVIVYQRPLHAGLATAIRGHRHHIDYPLVVVDEDDNTFHVKPDNQAYIAFGEEEMDVDFGNGPQPVWRHGKSRNSDGKYFDIYRNQQQNRAHAQAIQDADMVTVAGDGLAEYFRDEFGCTNVHTFPNIIDFRRWNFLPRQKPDDAIRFGWQGGASHFQDWCLIRDAVVEAMKIEPRLKLVLYGQYFDGIFKLIDPRRIEIHPWVHVEAHPAKMSAIGYDFAVIPLLDDEFCKGKSVIKWSEFGALRVPCIISRSELYKEVRDGMDGLFASSKEEWIQKILLLARREDLRRRIGEESYHEQKRRFNADTKPFDFARAYARSLLRKRRGEFLDGRIWSPRRSERWWSPAPELVPVPGD